MIAHATAPDTDPLALAGLAAEARDLAEELGALLGTRPDLPAEVLPLSERR